MPQRLISLNSAPGQGVRRPPGPNEIGGQPA
jgi:hypothetical protein